MFEAIFGVLSPIISKALDFIPNPVERAKAQAQMEADIRAQQMELMKAFAQNDLAQLEVDKAEAENTHLFVSGWRPFVGWVCGSGFAWAFVFKPLLDWTLAACHSTAVTPSLDTAQLSQLLMGMLGMGAIRSYEKVKGVASK